MFWPMVGRVYEQSHQTDLQFYFAQHVEPLVVENMALLQLLTSQQLVISIDFMQPYGYFSRPLLRVIILYLYWGGDWVSEWINFILKLVIRHFNMTRVLHVHVVVLHCTSIFKAIQIIIREGVERATVMKFMDSYMFKNMSYMYFIAIYRVGNMVLIVISCKEIRVETSFNCLFVPSVK